MTLKLLVMLLAGSLSVLAQQQAPAPTTAPSPAPAKSAESAATSPQVQPSPEAPAPPCLIVKHKGTIGRRLMWTALIGVPIAPGSKYDYVDSVNYTNTKMAYKGKELEQLQASGTRVVVLENKHTSDDVAAARKSCHEPKSVELPAKK